MKKLLVLASLTVGGVAAAEDAPDPLNASDLVSPTSVVRGIGVKVGEGTVIHPTLGVETGVVSNVFYEEQTSRVAGLLRIIGDLSTGSLPSERLGINNEAATDAAEQAREVGMLQYLATLYGTYDRYLSTNDAVLDQGGLGGGVLFKGIVNPQKTFSLSFLEHFDRAVRATNFESGESLNRDVNQVALRLNFQPRGRSLGGYVYWRNLIDYFENDQTQFSNRHQNTFGTRVNYQWLPLTRAFIDASIGVFTGLGSESTKVDSFPLKVETGIQTAITLNFNVNARIGYTKGFYASGDDFSAITGGIQLGYRYSPRGRATLLYDYAHHDSINANFYRDHTVKLAFDQQFAPFAVNAGAEVHVRHYASTLVMDTGGSNQRDDLIGAINLSARYMFRGWIAAVADYQFAAVATDFEYDAGGGVIDDPSYLRHQLLVGVRAAY